MVQAQKNRRIEYSLIFFALKEEKEMEDSDIEDIIAFMEDLGINVTGKPPK